MKKVHFISSVIFSLVGLLGVQGAALAAVVVPPPPSLPTTTAECKHGGWKNYGDVFKNQGDCVSFVVTDGRNEPSGSVPQE
jgi:hypothetical protein